MEASFSEWTERFKTYNEYIKALADYKLKTAQSELTLAQAANQWATVRARQLLIDHLVRDLKAFSRAKKRNAKEVKSIKEKDRRARMLLRGSKIKSLSFSQAWTAYVYFESRAMIQLGEALYKIRVKASARSESNFIATRTKGKVVSAPSEVENVLQLMHWLKQKRFVPAAGSPAQQVVVKLFQAINKVATKDIAVINTRIDAIKKDEFKAWEQIKPIVGVSTNAAAKKIQEAGSKTV